MSGKSTYLSNGWLNLFFQGIELVGLAQNDGTPLTEFYISLHTSDPGPAGDQTTNEVNYTGYVRVGVTRNSGGWTTATAESVSPQASITWPVSTGGPSPVAAFWAIGTLASGAGELLYTGPITPPITCGSGIQPQLTTASYVAEA